MVLGRKTNFFLEKDGNQLFLRKKMVLGRRTNFFLGKTKKTIFLEFGRIVSQKMFFLVFWFFLGKSWFFCPKPSFSKEKVGFPVQNHFFPRKNQKNHLFGVWPHSVSKDGFFFWFFWFSLGKVGFGLGGYSAAVDFVLTSNPNELTDMSC